MRQRRIKDLDEKIESYSHYMVKEPKEAKGSWNEIFGNSNPIFLEIGCGKGKFIIQKAVENPDMNFIAIEGQDSVIVRALEKAEGAQVNNLKIVLEYAEDLSVMFEKAELNGIYLNFSDPWPKARHAKRRLTYHKRLANYMAVLPENGFVEFKTDNDSLFDFTLEEIASSGLQAREMTRDLHNSDYPSKHITTEYEERFKTQGKNINYVRIER